MLNAFLRSKLDPVLSAAARKLGWNAMVVAFVGFAIGLAALPAVAKHYFLAGLGLFLASRLVFGFAAAAGRQAEAKGELALVYVLGTVALAGFPFAFALAAPEHAEAAAFLMFALTALFIAAFAFAKDDAPRQGVIGEAELILAFALAAIFPDWFGTIAYVTGVLGFVAAGMRIDSGLAALR